MNFVALRGNVARDVELKHTSSGKAVVTTVLAVNRRGKDARTDFIDIVIWDKLAETFGKYVTKGKEVLVQGRIQTRSYDDKNGNKRYVTEVVVQMFEFVGKKGDAPAGGIEGTQAKDEDIPF